MEPSVVKIEELIQEKISLYRELLATVQQEKKVLSKSDVDSLWKISQKKQALAAEIEALRRKVLTVLTANSIRHDMDVSSFRMSQILPLLPAETMTNLHKLNATLNLIKANIDGLVQANRRFVEGYLSMVEDLIGIIAGTGQPASVYASGRCKETDCKTNLFVHKEV